MPDTLLQCIGLGFGAILHHILHHKLKKRTLCNIIHNHARKDLALLSWWDDFFLNVGRKLVKNCPKAEYCVSKMIKIFFQGILFFSKIWQIFFPKKLNSWQNILFLILRLKFCKVWPPKNEIKSQITNGCGEDHCGEHTYKCLGDFNIWMIFLSNNLSSS